MTRHGRVLGLIVLAGWPVICGCVSPNYKITGQVDMLQTDEHGDITTAEDNEPIKHVTITKGDTFSLRLSSAFVKESKDVAGSEFLVYAEIYDIQPDDRQRLVKVLFKENNQAAGFLLNQRDRLMFGPIAYSGNPIRIRLFIVELDKDENDIVRELVKQAVHVAASFAPAVAPFEGTVTSVADLLLTLNPDDREFAYDLTLFPRTHSHGPYLQSGYIPLIKTENRRRFTGLFATKEAVQNPSNYSADPDEVRDEFGNLIQAKFEDYADVFTYDENQHPLSGSDNVNAWTVLRAMGGRLWLQNVAFERVNRNGEAGTTTEMLLAEARIQPNRDQLRPNGTEVFNVQIGGTSHEILKVADSKGTEHQFRLGRRAPYMEKTHVVLTVARGGEPLERSLFEELSALDQKLLQESLQPDLNAVLVTDAIARVGTSVDHARNVLLERARARDVVRQVNSSFGRDTDARISARYPMEFLRRLSLFGNGEDRALNAGIIDIVASMVDGFPISKEYAGNQGVINYLRGLVTQHGPNPESVFKPLGDGTYTFALPLPDPAILFPEPQQHPGPAKQAARIEEGERVQR